MSADQQEIERLRERERTLIEVTRLFAGRFSIEELLEKILTVLRTVTRSDAGSLYVVEGGNSLKFSAAQNDSVEVPFTSFTLPVSNQNIAGYVAMTGEPLRFDDVYRLDPALPYHFNLDFDDKFQYRTKSMLAIPLKNNRQQVVGVLQLINKKRSSADRIVGPTTAEAAVVPFTEEDENFLEILAAQAGIALEHAKLFEVTAMLSHRHTLEELLEKIVTNLRTVTRSDAGSLYVVEGEKNLRFSVAQNDSVEVPFSSFTLPIANTNIAGYVAMTGEPLRFDDAYRLDESLPFHFNRGFDEKFRYRTKSMLTVPMTNNRNRVVGVLQLINKKRLLTGKIVDEISAEETVEPFTTEDEDFLKILAAQAGIAVERAKLYEDIERLVLGMIESSSASIESRDKTTAGHSQRISCYMVVLAKRMNLATEGAFKDINFTPLQIRELCFAAMLHDIGKIGVREYVLMKQNKLTDDRMEIIHLRIAVEIMHDPSKKAEWDEIWEFLKVVNMPSFLPDDKHARLQELANRPVRNADGTTRPLLDPVELENLSIRKGNLTDSERKEIESHVWHSAQILNKIPWTEDLKRVPIIAGTHHEKLSGKGYPDGLDKTKIPFEGKMLAVCDVFEALTANDRPYKKAMPVEKAIEILRMDAKVDSLETAIVEFFVAEKVYECITPEQRKKFDLTAAQILALS